MNMQALAITVDYPEETLSGPICCDCGASITSYSRGRCKPCGDKARKRPVPTDFGDKIKMLGSTGAANHYRASLTTITYWRTLIGLKPQYRAKRPKPGSRLGAFKLPRQTPLHVTRDLSHAGQAADFLRKWMAISKCNEQGKFDHKGQYWRLGGGRILNADEVMYRAGRLGWIVTTRIG